MSHVASLEAGFKDLECVKAAVKEMGGTFIQDQATYQWWGRFMDDWSSDRAAANKGYDPATFGKCLHAIRPAGWQQGDYEIGVIRNPKGDGYNLIYDSYGSAGRKIEAWAGENCKGLMKPVKMQETRKFWEKRGKRVIQGVDEQGRSVLKVQA